MLTEKYVNFIAEQVRRERVLGFRDVNESAEHFAKVMKQVDHAEENMHDGSHDFHSKDDHKTTVKKLVSHLKKAGHRDVKVEVDRRDRTIADYILDLRAAHFDCELQLGKVRTYHEAAE
jgi:hypothetical protein